MEKSSYFSFSEKVKISGNFTFFTVEIIFSHPVKFTEISRIFHLSVKLSENEISLLKNDSKPLFWGCEICEISEISLFFTFHKTTPTSHPIFFLDF